jgi:DNA polymerase-3 subunit delta'
VNPVIHPETDHQLDVFSRQQPHALLITGPHGVGLSTLAAKAVGDTDAQVLTVLPEKNEKIDLEKGTITVESIRKLYDATRTVAPEGRVILIDFAERMAPAAQNAFLKLLEEPSHGTRFILLTHQPGVLLPTITSRAQRIDARPVTRQQSEALLEALGVHDATKKAQLLFIAEGLPAALIKLAKQDELFAARASIVKDARGLVTGSGYERLLIAKKYKDSRPDALMLLEDALKLLRRSLAERGDAVSLRTLTRFEQLHTRITEQGNIRLQLSASVVVL